MPNKVLGFVNIAINSDIKGFETGLSLAKRKLTDAVSSFGSLAKSAGEKISQGLASTGNVAKRFDNMGVSAGNLVSGLGRLVNAVNPAEKKFTAFGLTGSSVLSTLGDSIKQSGVGFAGLLNPIGLAQVAVKTFANIAVNNVDAIISGMVKLINKFVDLYNNSILVRIVVEYIKLAFVQMFEVVKGFVKVSIEGFSAIFRLVKAGFSRDFAQIPIIVAEVIGNVGDILDDGAKAWSGALTNAVDNTLNGKLEYVSEDTVRKIINKFKGISEESAKVFYDRWTATVNNFKFNVLIDANVNTQLLNATDFELPNIDISEQNQLGLDIYGKLQKELDLITEKQNVYGLSVDSGIEKIDAYRGALNKLIDSGFSAGSKQVAAFTSQLKELEQTEIAKVFDDVAIKMDLVSQKQVRIGETSEITQEKQEIYNTSIARMSEILGGNVSPALSHFLEQMIFVDDALNTVSVNVSEVFTAAIDGISGAFVNAFTGAQNFGEALSGAFDGVLKAISSVLDQLGNAAIFQGKTIEAMKASFTFFSGFGSIAAGIALKVFAGLIKNTVSNIAPKLAKGGLAFGETLAVVGDNPNARVDPEVIAPLSKLKQYIGEAKESTRQVLSAVVSGSDLRFVLQQADFENQFISGR